MQEKRKASSSCSHDSEEIIQLIQLFSQSEDEIRLVRHYNEQMSRQFQQQFQRFQSIVMQFLPPNTHSLNKISSKTTTKRKTNNKLISMSNRNTNNN